MTIDSIPSRGILMYGTEKITNDIVYVEHRPPLLPLLPPLPLHYQHLLPLHQGPFLAFPSQNTAVELEKAYNIKRF